MGYGLKFELVDTMTICRNNTAQHSDLQNQHHMTAYSGVTGKGSQGWTHLSQVYGGTVADVQTPVPHKSGRSITAE